MNIKRHHRLNQWPSWFIGRALAAAALTLAFLLTPGMAQSPCIFTPMAPPGNVYPLIDWQLLDCGALPQIYAYLMSDGDAVGITVADAGLPPNKMRITLRSGNITFRKEIAAWNEITGQSTTLFTENKNHGPTSMTITKTNCDNGPDGADTIVFRKSKNLLGGVFDVYHLDPTNFWRLYGGKSITINWAGDNEPGAQYPPPCESPCVPVGTVVQHPPRLGAVVFRPSDGLFAKWYSDETIGPDFIYQASRFIAGGPGALPGAQLIPGDFNGDGKTDILVFRSSDGQFAKWYGGGTIGPDFNYQAGRFIAGSPGALQGAQLIPGDFNGDGKTDILVFRSSDGQFAKWYSNGTIGPDFNYQ
ncbi:MAG: FG-GAP repeat domain-containing protein, partial [Blastocatellia bacterium]